MAEGFTNHFLKDKWRAYSAGLEPSVVNPIAVETMDEIGIDISFHHSKHVDEMIDKQFDLVITVCDNADEHCPIFPGNTKKVHIGFDDPAKTTGTEDEVKSVFRLARDKIRNEIIKYLSND